MPVPVRLLGALAALGLIAACSTDGASTTPGPAASSTSAAAPPGAAGPTDGRPAVTRTSSSTTDTQPTTDPATVPAIALLLESASPLRRHSVGPDTLGVWVCRVALDVTDPVYNAADLRLDFTPQQIAATLEEHVVPYFESLSHGLYQPRFVAGGEVAIAAPQTSRDCVSQAQDAAGDDIDGVVVVADAEHAANQPGGWGRPGKDCAADAACPARVSGRGTYIGASDFHPDWGPIPAVDLQEHELGHSLGLPHSGDDNHHTSALDLMSNSAAPRDVDGARRHGPDTLAVNRLAAGWLPLDAVAVAPTDGGTFVLTPSNGERGTRLLVLPLDDEHFVTVELLVAEGYDDHLPESGIAIHLIDQRAAACHTSSSDVPCVNELRRQTPLLGASPHTDLLGVGETWSDLGWSVTVTAAGDGGWTVTVA